MNGAGADGNPGTQEPGELTAALMIRTLVHRIRTWQLEGWQAGRLADWQTGRERHQTCREPRVMFHLPPRAMGHDTVERLGYEMSRLLHFLHRLQSHTVGTMKGRRQMPDPLMPRDYY